jgi:hypothetical protein
METHLENVVEDLTRGNVTEVKVLLASVALALAVYQLMLIAVAYGRVRPPVLEPRPGSHPSLRRTVRAATRSSSCCSSSR